MKKRMFAIFIMLAGLIGCTKNTSEPTVDSDDFEYGKITHLYYLYNNSFAPQNDVYDIQVENGVVTFQYSSQEYPDYGTIEAQIDPSIVSSIEEAIQEYQIGAWDGFHEIDSNVMDGDGFSLSISFDNGKSIDASGSNAYPKGYVDFIQKVDNILKPIKEDMIENHKSKIIEQGIQGNLNYIRIDFLQQGTSGDDEYSFVLASTDVYKYNFNVEIVSESEEFLPKGEYEYLSTVDDDKICFKEVQELLEKYNIISWYGYDESAEDYNNEEWFQFDFMFENEFNLSGYGTKHPENYDAFRKEFLTLMCNQVQQFEAEGIIENKK